ncbi:serine/threonine protein kinase [Coleofasciculus sp. G2-EDA-02]|uniref:serine/threonine protein kinase n=1 Tax=Coleofasciculus sp. G2-EDA-02 TaxID=3069529 RepID=UPI0032FAC17C
MELLHQSGEIIAQSYRIIRILGQGGIGITYEAQNLKTHQSVALKSLSLRRMTDWKVLELFEREAHILAHLNHPAIPHYLDYFQVDTSQDCYFYIVQQLAPGNSLATLVENGWKPNEREVKHLAAQVLEILVYLQQLTPPVIHRDIKPQNIIRTEDGQVFLVDFGAVQDTYHNTVTGGSTVVGTYGYMAPEQFRGQATPATDLYGLGTTLLFLLMGKSPADLPQRQLKIHFRSHVRISKPFADWLEKMLEPAIENRFPSAHAALAVLKGEKSADDCIVQKPCRPKYTPIRLTETEERLLIEIPPVLLRTKHSQIFGLIFLIWTGCTLPLALIYYTFSNYINQSSIGLFFVHIILTWGIVGLLSYLSSITSRKRLEIDIKNIRIFIWNLRLSQGKIQGYTQKIKQVKLGLFPLYGQYIVLDMPSLRWYSKFSFGFYLTKPEQEWLVWEIRTFLDKVRNTEQGRVNSLPESDLKNNDRRRL